MDVQIKNVMQKEAKQCSDFLMKCKPLISDCFYLFKKVAMLYNFPKTHANYGNVSFLF